MGKYILHFFISLAKPEKVTRRYAIGSLAWLAHISDLKAPMWVHYIYLAIVLLCIFSALIVPDWKEYK